jgi:hypothetical protein
MVHIIFVYNLDKWLSELSVGSVIHYFSNGMTLCAAGVCSRSA